MENIGDSGLIQAFRAWKAQFDEEKHDYLLPGLTYTREQLFFIAFGRIWATNMRPEAAVSAGCSGYSVKLTTSCSYCRSRG